jgi:hypothetical protein
MDDPKIAEALRRETELMDASRSDRIVIEKCDSPIEDQFLWEFRKVAHHEVAVGRQLEVKTDRGTFILDFVIEHLPDGKKMGIECDGRDFHTADRDSERDAAIIRTGVVNKIYRLRGRDIFCHVYELLDLLGWCEPWILSLRGKLNLDARTLPEVHRRQSKGRYALFFPFAAVRIYDPPDYDPEDNDPDTDYTHPRRPILLAWTQRIEEANKTRHSNHH